MTKQIALPYKGRQAATHTFSIDITAADGVQYKGNFTVKKLSIRDIAALGVRKAQLNGGMHHDPNHPGMGVDEGTDQYNQMIAHLEIAIIAHPPWWDLNNLHDSQVLGAVWEEAFKFEQSFLERAGRSGAAGGQGASHPGGGESDQAGTNAPGAPSPVVVSEVQSALEP